MPDSAAEVLPISLLNKVRMQHIDCQWHVQAPASLASQTSVGTASALATTHMAATSLAYTDSAKF